MRALLLFFGVIACHGDLAEDSGAGPRLVSGPEPLQVGLLDAGEATRRVYELPDRVCPDGQAARFHVVEPAAGGDGRPIVLALHGGCFDFVEDGGQHWAAPQDKLSQSWAECKLRDFMGEAATECQDAEQNGGAIVASLVRAGAVVVLPANCYGDIWHGTGYEDPDDGFAREGLSLAIQALDFGESLTGAQGRYVWGTSAGAHGVAELVVAGEPFERVLADSAPDYLPGSYGDPVTDAAREGLRRIYEGDDSVAQVGAFSLASAVQGGYREPALYLFSCNDTEVPNAQSEPAAQALLERYEHADDACVIHAKLGGDDDLVGHVFSNSDLSIAGPLADWLLNGVRPDGHCEQVFTACP